MIFDTATKKQIQMNAKLTILMAVSLLAVFVSCKPKEQTAAAAPPPESPAVEVNNSPVKSDPDTLVYYRRGACFGMCPIFSLVIYTDGRAVYKGVNHVNRIGTYQASVQDTALVKVFTTAESIGYFGMQEVYDNPSVTDLPTIELAIRKDGKLKRVKARYKAPASLQKLYEALDQMTDIQKWERLEEKE